jgi:hypothetical protein
MISGHTGLPVYRTMTPYKAVPHQGMPGPYIGEAVRVHSDAAVDELANRVKGEP